MAEEINTHYLKGGFAVADDVVLVQTPTTRTVFRPAIHGGGVRGQVIRQKIGQDGRWADISEVDFRRLPADAGVAIDLDTAGTKLLHDKLSTLYEVQGKGVEYGDQKYVVAKESEVLIIDDVSKRKAIQEIIDQGYSEEFWQNLAQKNPDLATRLAVAQIQIDRQDVVKEFETSMRSFASNEAYWQKFFEDNPWILQYAFSAPVHMLAGETYLGGKSSKGRGGNGGVATDYLFRDESTKNFAVVEVKTPNSKLTSILYRGEKGSGGTNELYSMHTDLSGGVVQVRTQMSTAVEHFQSILGPEYDHKLRRVHPTGVLITGNLGGLSDKEADSFNHFRHGQHDLAIITYDELLMRLKIIFDGKADNKSETELHTVTEDSPAVSSQPPSLDDLPF